MSSYKIAIENLQSIESRFYEEQNIIFCDKKYAVLKNKIDKEIFNSNISDILFENVWLKNNYDLIFSQDISNKLFEISCSLSPLIANNILMEVLKETGYKIEIKKEIIFQLNHLCDKGLEKILLCRLRKKQKEYIINIISNRPEEFSYLCFLLNKVYL